MPRKKTRPPAERIDEQPRPVGRPSDFRPEYIERARVLAHDGATDVDLAEEFGVGLATLHRWKNAFPEFRDSLKVGKGKADERVKRTLLERALGYSYPVEEIFWDASTHQVVRAVYTKTVLPDITAMIFWLKNRMPEEFRERREEPPPSDKDDEVATLARRLRKALNEADEATPTVEPAKPDEEKK